MVQGIPFGEYCHMIRHIPYDGKTDLDIPFTDPFRYTPHPLVQEAASVIMSEISEDPELSEAFSEGKMLGILICHPEHHYCHPEHHDCHPERSRGIPFLAAFSGNVGGRSMIEGFVPPIYDLTVKDGTYRTREAEISAINSEIHSIELFELSPVEIGLHRLKIESETELSEMRAGMKLRKYERMTLRKCWDSEGREYYEEKDALILQSQHEKAEFKRAKDRWRKAIAEKEDELNAVRDRLEDLKSRRAAMSDDLQKWIFRQYVVCNLNGEEKSILDIFREKGLVPPGGTGECAAPKLLDYAFRHGLRPLAMGEFWYGKSPDTAVRTHGHFYPSCTSKCGPLLSWMLQYNTPRGVRGIKTMAARGPVNGRGPTQLGGIQFLYPSPPGAEIIYEDEWLIVVSKPSGMPSVPGLDGNTSLLEHLQQEKGEIHSVHRLDMDTSGIMIFAKTEKVATSLQRQFEEHSVHKTYKARLCPSDISGMNTCIPRLKKGDKGQISLPLSADYDERPRQKVDFNQGKNAITEYEVTDTHPDGTCDVIFRPITGRTHQLRVHAAHHLGMERPIAGDMLYGGQTHGDRLHLHAHSIIFIHPETQKMLSFATEIHSYE